MSAEETIRPGDVIAATWQIDSVLRAGRSGTVYLATDLRLGRRVAVKTLSPGAVDEQAVARLEREAGLLAKLSHPNVVTLHMFERHEGVPYLVMQLLEGVSLEERVLLQGGLGEREVAAISEQISSALSYLHAQGLLHRDLKPSNLIISSRGHVTLIDLGITRPHDSALTRTGVVHGTPGYMSPEAILGERNLDGRSDMYSLAAVLFELLTGSLPFGHLEGEALLRAHLGAPRPRAHELRRSLPPAVSAVLARAMALEPDGRYANIADFQEAFRAALAPALNPSLPEPATLPGRPALSISSDDPESSSPDGAAGAKETPVASPVPSPSGEGPTAQRPALSEDSKTQVSFAPTPRRAEEVATGPMPALVAPGPPQAPPASAAAASAPLPPRGHAVPGLPARPRPKESGPPPVARSAPRDAAGAGPGLKALAAQQGVAVTPVGLKPLKRDGYPADEPSFLKRRARAVWGGVIGVALLLSLLAIFWPSGEPVGPAPAQPLPVSVVGLSTTPAPPPTVSIPSTSGSASAEDIRAKQDIRPVVKERPRPQVRKGNAVPPARILQHRRGKGMPTLLVSEALIVATFNEKPVAALVEVDEIFRGQTPLTLTLPAGPHVLRLDYKKAAVTEFATEFPPGKSVRLEVDLPSAKEARERETRKREKHAH